MKIDKEHIKSFVKDIPKKIWLGIKNIYELPHSGKYLLLSMFLLILFLLLTFPYDLLILKKINELERKDFKSIDLPVFKFSIIGNTEIENPTIILNNGDEITLEKATIATPNPISFLLSKKIKSNFLVNFLKYTWKDSELITTFGGNTELFLDKQTYALTNGSLQTESIDIKIRPVNISIPTNFGPVLLKRDSITINIKEGINCKITNGVLKFDKIESSGDITAEISGTINLTNKKLDLTIYIDTDVKELEPYKDLLYSKYIKNNRIGIKIGGGADKPEPTLIEKGKDEN